jgi:hypothetical protein
MLEAEHCPPRLLMCPKNTELLALALLVRSNLIAPF